TVLVFMALITTLLTQPLLHLVRRLARPPREPLPAHTRTEPGRPASTTRAD
ncbi:MAG: integral membrane ion exchanger, partial [Streptomyces sp.]|nr:integral membrane ion exchanger [Streptomyces sp.]